MLWAPSVWPVPPSQPCRAGGVQQGCQTQSPLGAEMRLATYLGLAPADIQDTGLQNQGPLTGWGALSTAGEHP